MFGSLVTKNANGYVAQANVNLPIPILSTKPRSVVASRHNQENGVMGVNSSVSCLFANDSVVTISLQNPNSGYADASETWRTVMYYTIGFWK